MSLLMGICMDMPNFATYKSYKDASADLARKQASKQVSKYINQCINCNCINTCTMFCFICYCFAVGYKAWDKVCKFRTA